MKNWPSAFALVSCLFVGGCYDLKPLYPEGFNVCGDAHPALEINAKYSFIRNGGEWFLQQFEERSGCFALREGQTNPAFLDGKDATYRLKKINDELYLGSAVGGRPTDQGFLVIRFPDGEYRISYGAEPVSDVFEYIFNTYYAKEPGADAVDDPTNPFADIGKEESENSSYAQERKYIQEVITSSGNKNMAKMPISSLVVLSLVADYLKNDPNGIKYTASYNFKRL